MKFKYLLEAQGSSDSEFDLYPVIQDIVKLGKEFQKDGEILWVNKSGQKFRTYHNGKIHQYEKEPYTLFQLGKNDDYDETLVRSSRYVLHFPEGLKGPRP